MSVKRYNGSTWDTYAGATNLSATQSQWKKTAAGGETTLSGSDDSLITLAYTVGQEAVYVNGVLQVRGSDYTATDGSSVVLTSPLVANNVVQVISAVAYAVANVIPGTTITTKGDLVTGSAIGTPTRLPIGTNNSFLVADSTQATGIRWSTNGGTFTTWRKAAAGGETTLTGTDDFALTLAYTAGQEMVYINGVLLERGVDYTASNGTSVTGLTALVAGDVATVVTIGTFAIPDAITKSTVTAKGDLLAATGSGTVVNLAAGSDGSVLVANSAAATGVSWAGNQFAGKNKLINGDFGVWQRGTSFSSATGIGYTADRWFLSWSGVTTIAVSRQTFTPGAAPVAGYEGSYFARITRTAGSADDYFLQRIEDCRTFAGQTVTVSFWAKAASATTITQVYAAPNAGTGGSGAPGGAGSFSGISIGTTWQRYSATWTMNAITGTTIGTNSFVELVFKLGSAMGNITLDLWGVQLEAGSVATTFQTATGSIQGELAACQRYYFRQTSNATNGAAVPIATGVAGSTTALYAVMHYPVTMRATPTSVDFANINTWQGGGLTAISNVVLTSNSVGTDKTLLTCTTTGLTNTQSYGVLTNASGVSGYIGLSAEL